MTKLVHLLALGALAVAGLAAHASPAHADCARQMWLGTPSGTTLPKVGSLYLDDEGQALSARPPLQVSFSGAPGVYNVVRVGAQVLRLDYVGFDGGTLDVALGDDEHATYPLAGDWHAGPAPRVLEYWHDAYAWECSRADALMIQIDEPTAAIVARWTFHGDTQEWLIPARTREDVPGVSVLPLGHVNCGNSTTLPPAQLQGGGHLELTAIGFDGSRTAIRGLPERLAVTDMPTTEDSLGQMLKMDPDTLASLRTPPPVAAPAPLVPAGWNPFRDLDTALGLALGGGIALSFAIFFGLKLRPALRDPAGTP